MPVIVLWLSLLEDEHFSKQSLPVARPMLPLFIYISTSHLQTLELF
jgi:hypothetical protein